MKNISLPILAIVPFATFAAFSFHANRGIPNWDYDMLESQSTHIIIALAVENRPANADDELPPWEGDRSEVDGVITTFHVQAVLKGSIKEDAITIAHFKDSKTSNIMGNPPHFVDFEPHLVVVEKNMPDPRLQFVLFLVKSTDGTYQFATGTTDPLFSIKQIRQLPE